MSVARYGMKVVRDENKLGKTNRFKVGRKSESLDIKLYIFYNKHF